MFRLIGLYTLYGAGLRYDIDLEHMPTPSFNAKDRYVP